MRITLKKVLAVGSGVLLVGTILIYAYYQSLAIIEGPQISVIAPENGITSTTSLVHIYGSVRHAKETTLQGRPIFIDLEGRFSEQLLLAEGYNIIELTAKDAQGREIKRKLELVYQKPYSGITF